MGESQITVKESTKELVKLSCLVATAFILLINVLGFVVTKFYMSRAMILPAPTRILIELQHALRINIFFTIPIAAFVIILLFLLENFAVKSHVLTYGIYKKINLFLTIFYSRYMKGFFCRYAKGLRLAEKTGEKYS